MTLLSTKLHKTILITMTLLSLGSNTVNAAVEDGIVATNPEYAGYYPPQIDLVETARLSTIQCMTLNLYRESRSESELSNMMIAGVVLNRVEDSRFPNTPCEVIFSKKQFSWTIDMIYSEIKNPAQYERLYRLSEYILMNRDFVRTLTQGATHYHEKSIKPYWVNKDMKYISRIDKHLFYKWEVK